VLIRRQLKRRVRERQLKRRVRELPLDILELFFLTPFVECEMLLDL
jgi:hypothetical protein